MFRALCVADVLHFHVHLTARRLAQKARRPQLPGIARAQNVLQVRERQPGVDDVLDDDDVAAVERGVEVLQHPHFARCRGSLGVAGHGHEVQRHVAGHVADEVRQEHKGTFEHGDHMQIAGEVAPDLERHFGDAFPNLIL